MIGFEISPGQMRPPASLPLAAYFAGGGGESVGLAEGSGGGLTVWTEVAPNMAACLRLDNANSASRYSWRETLLMELRNIYPVRALTLTGGWSQLQSSGSGISTSYLGNRAISTSSASATAEVAVGRTAPYDVWVYYTGRTSGGYCRVDIDGSQDLVTEISDPAALGFKAFSTYMPVDLQRKQAVKVATGLTGAHVVTLTNAGAATPGGSAIMIEAIATTGALGDDHILPPVWQPETAYVMGDEVQFGGIFYAARGTGQSGTVGPLHTGGIATDGALNWRADNRTTYQKFVAIDYPSEREYAVRFAVGASNTELGGQTHGNEQLVSRSITLDGVTWVPETTGTGISVGTQLQMIEDMQWQQANGTHVADCQLVRTVIPGEVSHQVTVTGVGPQASFEWLYAGMLPMVHWDGESRTSVIEGVALPGAQVIALSDYSGVSPASLEFPSQNLMGMNGTVQGHDLRYGLEVGKIATAGNVIGSFDAFLRPNIDAATAAGNLDWKAKGYVNAGSVTMSAGDVIAFHNRHVLSMA